MDKPIIVVKVTAKQFKALVLLIQHVILNMTSNLNFLVPSPTLLALQSALDDLNAALTLWGPKGHRGGHDAYVSLIAKAVYAHTLITQEADYCMTAVNPTLTFEAQTVILSSSGFTLKNARTPQGILQMVQNFHRFISRAVGLNQVKLKWKKPLNVTSRANVKGYKIYRNSVNIFSTATIINSIGITSYIDTPASGSWFYWVVPYNKNGDGIPSTVVFVAMAGG